MNRWNNGKKNVGVIKLGVINGKMIANGTSTENCSY